MNYTNNYDILFIFDCNMCIMRFGDIFIKLSGTNVSTISINDNIKKIIYIGNETKFKVIQEIFKNKSPTRIETYGKSFNSLCVICYSRDSELTNFPCMHKTICRECFPDDEKKINLLLLKCPICKSNIDFSCILN